ncbi:MAG: class I SAM-dependent methyltransferase [Planctomycetota bacterium]|jgi:predicted O-methyltransferase YrrM
MSDPDFTEVWAAARAQVGWFSRAEARELFALACAVPRGQVIVEIGSYAGRATVVLAHAGRKVIAIDPLVFGTKPTGTWEVGPEHVAEFRKVLERYPNSEWLRVRSARAPVPRERVGLLLIDGDHDAPAPLEDFRHFEPSLAPGAAVCFHDYKVCSGVTEAADALVAEGAVERVRLRERLFVGRRTG